jgi:hypothetical protein
MFFFLFFLTLDSDEGEQGFFLKMLPKTEKAGVDNKLLSKKRRSEGINALNRTQEREA